MLFLGTNDAEFLRAYGLLLLWSEGYVEPVVPPPSPRHVAAQQLLGLVLQERHVGRNVWPEWFGALGLASPDEWTAIQDWLLQQGHLDEDGGMLFVGPEAERRYGKIHYRDLMAVFTADPQIIVLHGRQEVGAVDPMLLQRKVEGPRLITLGGRPWRVTYIDWKRRKAFVEPSDSGGTVRWMSMPQPISYALSDAVRRVLLGAEPAGVRLTKRAQDRVADLRAEYAHRVDSSGSVVTGQDDSRVRWWTWAGARANAVLAAALSDVAPELFETSTAFDNFQIALRSDATGGSVFSALRLAQEMFGTELAAAVPEVDEKAVRQLKFLEMLPPDLSLRTVAERINDRIGMIHVLERCHVTAS